MRQAEAVLDRIEALTAEARRLAEDLPEDERKQAERIIAPRVLDVCDLAEHLDRHW